MSSSSSFDLGSFAFHEEKSSKRKPEKFSWRLDPEESFSDWTILLDVIRHDDDEDDDCQDDNETDIQTEFHVHKSYLAAGERHSLYFQRVFKVQMNVEESLDATSRIQLEESAARAIPIFLDFLYENDHVLQVSTPESAVALRWIASYFGVESMFLQVNEYIHKDLNSSKGIQHCLCYLKEAALYGDEKVSQAACSVCAKKFAKLKVEDMVRLSPTQFSSIVEEAKTTGPSASGFNSDFMSARVATYCDARRDDIAPDMLLKWTDPNYMNVINAKAAVSLLRHAEEAGDYHQQHEKNDKNNNLHDDHSSLIERCIEAASNNWQVSLVDNIRSMEEAQSSGYAVMSATTRCRVLERSLMIANDQLNDVKRKLETSQARISALHHHHVRFENVVVMAAAAEEEGSSSITDDSYDSDDSVGITS